MAAAIAAGASAQVVEAGWAATGCAVTGCAVGTAR
jgi:hypothetical protein